MTLKQEHYIAGLLGVTAIVIFYILWKESQASSATAVTGVAPVAPTGAPSYPNAAPIDLGNITIGEAGPWQTTNAPATAKPQIRIGTAHSACGCEENDCEAAGTLVTTQTIPEPVLKAAKANYDSFAQKGTLEPATATTPTSNFVPINPLSAPSLSPLSAPINPL